jgi:hypothetical protein
MKPLYLCMFGLALVLACDGVSLPKGGSGKRSDKARKNKKKDKKKKKLGSAPEVEWGSMSRNHLKFKEDKLLGTKYGSEVRISMYQGKLRFSPVKMPSGTVLEADGQKLTVKANAFKDLELDVVKRLMDEPWATFQVDYPKVDWKIPFSVTLPRRKPVKRVTPPIQSGFVVGAYFKTMEKSGTTFLWPGEKVPSSEPIPKAAVWTFGGFKALGTAPSVKSVRWVAVVETTPNGKSRTCGGYIGVSAVKVNAYDATVRIVDRFTGTAHKEKTFKGRPSCPRSVYAKAGEKVVRSSGPSTKPMQKWVKGQLKRLPASL